VKTEDSVSSKRKRSVEHLTVAKFSPNDKNKDGKLIDVTTVQDQECL